MGAAVEGGGQHLICRQGLWLKRLAGGRGRWRNPRAEGGCSRSMVTQCGNRLTTRDPSDRPTTRPTGDRQTMNRRGLTGDGQTNGRRAKRRELTDDGQTLRHPDDGRTNKRRGLTDDGQTLRFTDRGQTNRRRNH